MTRRTRNALLALLAAVAATATSTSHAATISEIEDNNTCATAQLVSSPVSASTIVSGEITENDVDYFTFSGDPGAWVQVDLQGATSGVGTITDTVVGAFDSQCNALMSDDDGGAGAESQMLMKIPDDGVLTIAAAGFPDYSFTGSPSALGTYQLTVAPPSGDILVGTITVGKNGALPSDAYPSLALLRCADSSQTLCTDYAGAYGSVNSDGSYSISLADLEAGDYQLQVSASGFARAYSDHIQVTSGVGTIEQNVRLKALKITFSNATTCLQPAPGAACPFSFTVTNNNSSDMTIKLWAYASFTQSGGENAVTDFAYGVDGTPNPTKLTLAAGASQDLSMPTQLGDMPSGAVGYVEVFASKKGDQAQTVGLESGFGIAVTEDGQTTLVQGAQANLLRQKIEKQRALARRSKPLASADGDPTASGVVKISDRVPGGIQLVLRRCYIATSSICWQNMDSGISLSGGSFSFDMANMSTGRYQVWGILDGYAQSYSQAFDYDGATSISGLKVKMKLASILLSNLTTCDGQTADLGGSYEMQAGTDCTLSYDLSNQTDKDRNIDATVMVWVGYSGSDLGYSEYASGKNDGGKPIKVLVPAGQTVHVEQQVNTSKIKSGATGTLALIITKHGDPTKPFASFVGESYDFVP